MFNLIEELFSPSRKHEEDERQRLEHTRVEEGNADPGAGPIDLASGQVLIRPPAPRQAEAEAEARTETGTGTAGRGAEPVPGPESAADPEREQPGHVQG